MKKCKLPRLSGQVDAPLSSSPLCSARPEALGSEEENSIESPSHQVIIRHFQKGSNKGNCFTLVKPFVAAVGGRIVRG